MAVFIHPSWFFFYSFLTNDFVSHVYVWATDRFLSTKRPEWPRKKRPSCFRVCVQNWTRRQATWWDYAFLILGGASHWYWVLITAIHPKEYAGTGSHPMERRIHRPILKKINGSFPTCGSNGSKHEFQRKVSLWRKSEFI